MNRQHWRLLTRGGFFALFLFAPLLDLFRFDLTAGHFVILGQDWVFGDHAFSGSPTEAAATIALNVFLPILGFIAVAGVLIWRYGRLYCGWLCPHFSIVEIINQTMLTQLNRVTLWEKASRKTRGLLPWALVTALAISLAFVWAVSLLTYLMPPVPLLRDLIHLQLGFGSTCFIIAATTVFSIDFLFARHLFCKYGCALGIFQSLIWMGNSKGLVVSFDKKRADLCKDCDRECDKACPMRLPPRSIKRAKFTCTQCAQCLSACDRVQKDNPDGAVIRWVTGDEAKQVDRNAKR